MRAATVANGLGPKWIRSGHGAGLNSPGLPPATPFSGSRIVDTGLAKAREWSDEEVRRLTELYSSNKPFEDIVLELSSRSSNAIRLKASRMGLRRPTLPVNLIHAEKVRFQSMGEDGTMGYLIKCRECGSWIQAERMSGGICQTICCGECGALYEVLTES